MRFGGGGLWGLVVVVCGVWWWWFVRFGGGGLWGLGREFCSWVWGLMVAIIVVALMVVGCLLLAVEIGLKNFQKQLNIPDSTNNKNKKNSKKINNKTTKIT